MIVVRVPKYFVVRLSAVHAVTNHFVPAFYLWLLVVERWGRRFVIFKFSLFTSISRVAAWFGLIGDCMNCKSFHDY
jgi:hypothetical protein